MLCDRMGLGKTIECLGMILAVSLHSYAMFYMHDAGFGLMSGSTTLAQRITPCRRFSRYFEQTWPRMGAVHTHRLLCFETILLLCFSLVEVHVLWLSLSHYSRVLLVQTASNC